MSIADAVCEITSMKTPQQHIRFITRKVSRVCLTVLIAACCATALAPAQIRAQAQAKPKVQYQVSNLDSLGGPNSSVTWNVKNTEGIIVGISQTADPEPLGEFWSSAAFYSPPDNVGYINLGFIWEGDQMRGLPNFPGGNNGFATGANNFRQAVGWAENGVHDGACVSPQVLRFLPAKWTLGPDQIQDLPLIPGDSSGAA